MADIDIIITIPEAKIPLAKQAILHHSGEDDMTGAEMLEWIRNRWISDLKAMARKAQEAEYNNLFSFDNPLEG